MTTNQVRTAGDLGLPDGVSVSATVVETAVPHHPSRRGAQGLIVRNLKTVQAVRFAAGEAR
jgi:hypothetical protein